MYPLDKNAYHCTIDAVAVLNSAEVMPGLFAFRLTHQLAEGQKLPTSFEAMVSEHVLEGVCHADAIDAFKSGTTSKIKSLDLVVVTPEFLDVAQRRGFMAAAEARTADQRAYAGLRKDIYTALVDEEMPIDRLITADFSSHRLVRMDGTSLPVAIHCDYIEAGFHNGNYDLDRLVAKLKDDTRITFAEGKRGGGPTIGHHAIPFYNADEVRQRYVTFIYSPTAQEAIALWDKCISYGTKYPSTCRYQAMFDLDVLGLRANGIAKHDSFYVTEE